MGSRDAFAELLEAARRGDDEAAGALFPLVYDELRGLAESRLARLPPGQTLQATALVHEAWLKLAGGGAADWSGRAHFFGAAASAMRDILVDRARRKAAVKHGGSRRRVDLSALDVPFEAPAEDLLALDEVLRRLADADPRRHQLVMLRFFAGLGAEETAAVLGVSARTVERDWRWTKAWLLERLAADDTGAGR